MESYCTKKCSECTEREELGCPGCKNGPGMYPGGCEIADCCREKELENCSTCTQNETCEKYFKKERVSFEIELEQFKKDMYKRISSTARFKFLTDHVNILFWLMIPQIIANPITCLIAGKFSAVLSIVGIILSVLTTAAYSIILLKMAPQEKGYGKSGKYKLAAMIAFILFLLSYIVDGLMLLIYMEIPCILCLYLSEYDEYNTHADVLMDLDFKLNRRWNIMCWVYSVCIFITNVLLIIARYFYSPLLSITIYYIRTCSVSSQNHKGNNAASDVLLSVV